MGTGRVAPGPGRTPRPLIPAAETPEAGHAMVPSGPPRGVTGPGWAVPGRGGWQAGVAVTAAAAARPAARGPRVLRAAARADRVQVMRPVKAARCCQHAGGFRYAGDMRPARTIKACAC